MLLKKVGLMQTILEIMENNMLKWYGHILHMGDTRWHKRTLTWLPEEKERKTQNEMGKGGGKIDKAESNNCRCSTLANMVKSDTEPVTSVTLENCYRQIHSCVVQRNNQQ